MRLASIDQGTNTARLLIADADAGPTAPLHLETRFVRLGAGFGAAGRLTDEAIARALATHRDYAGLIREHKVDAVRAVGTGVLRKAPNAPEFIRRVEEESGTRIEIISGEEEADLSVKGALGALGVSIDSPRAYMNVDIGGFSTEFALWRGGHIVARQSENIGTVSLLEKHLSDDPPSAEQIAAARDELRRELANPGIVAQVVGGAEFTLLGCAGTFTTMAAMVQNLPKYDPSKVTGYELAISEIETLLGQALRYRAEERLNIWATLPKGREDVIVAGMILAEEVLRRWGKKSALVSDGSLLDGVWLDLLEARGGSV